MANLNVFLEQEIFEKFKEFKTLLKCRTNEETFKKILELAQQHLQQQVLKDIQSQHNHTSLNNTSLPTS